MPIEFNLKDVTHDVMVKFVESHLPYAKKPYTLRAAHQPELDIHALASKAEVYNLETSPKVIEEGLTEALKLMLYLLADGYRIKTPLFSIGMSIPGEYDGTESGLQDGLHPEARIHGSAFLRDYLKNNVRLAFIGVDAGGGVIGEAYDEVSGLANEAATIGGLLTIHGAALKIRSGAEHSGKTGLFFEPEADGAPVQAQIIVTNEPMTIKAIVPALETGRKYQLKIVTQSSAKGSGNILKEPRTIYSDFTLLAK